MRWEHEVCAIEPTHWQQIHFGQWPDRLHAICYRLSV